MMETREPELMLEFSEAMDIGRTLFHIDGKQILVEWSTSRSVVVDLGRYRADDTVHTLIIDGYDLQDNRMENVSIDFHFVIEEDVMEDPESNSNDAVLILLIIFAVAMISVSFVLMGLVVMKRRKEPDHLPNRHVPHPMGPDPGATSMTQVTHDTMRNMD